MGFPDKVWKLPPHIVIKLLFYGCSHCLTTTLRNLKMQFCKFFHLLFRFIFLSISELFFPDRCIFCVVFVLWFALLSDGESTWTWKSINAMATESAFYTTTMFFCNKKLHQKWKVKEVINTILLSSNSVFQSFSDGLHGQHIIWHKINARCAERSKMAGWRIKHWGLKMTFLN